MIETVVFLLANSNRIQGKSVPSIAPTLIRFIFGMTRCLPNFCALYSDTFLE